MTKTRLFVQDSFNCISHLMNTIFLSWGKLFFSLASVVARPHPQQSLSQSYNALIRPEEYARTQPRNWREWLLVVDCAILPRFPGNSSNAAQQHSTEETATMQLSFKRLKICLWAHGVHQQQQQNHQKAGLHNRMQSGGMKLFSTFIAATATTANFFFSRSAHNQRRDKRKLSGSWRVADWCLLPLLMLLQLPLPLPSQLQL